MPSNEERIFALKRLAVLSGEGRGWTRQYEQIAHCCTRLVKYELQHSVRNHDVFCRMCGRPLKGSDNNCAYKTNNITASV